VWIPSLLSVLAVSLVSLIGAATLSLDPGVLRRLASVLVSFATGALLGDAFLHLIPEAFGSGAPPLLPSLLVLGGMLLFFSSEKLLRHRHGPLSHRHHPEPRVKVELAAINVIGDAIHNFVDGLLIAGSYLVSPTLGVSTTIAVLFHEIPQELGDFGVLIHSGLGVRKAVLLNLVSASAALLGNFSGLFAGSVGGTAIESFLIPVTAGGFVYIAAANLIPELQHERSARAFLVQASGITAGIAVMALLAIAE